MSLKMRFVAAACGLLLASSGLAADVDMQPGLWEISTKMEMPGMPMQMPARKHRQCLTRQKMEPNAQGQETENCKITDRKISGNTVSWVIQCRGENAMRAVGKMTYHGDTLEGTITIKASDPEMGEMNMVNRISGRRIGECK